MENEISILKANINWLNEKVSLINTNLFAIFSITVAIFGIVGAYFIKTSVNRKVNKELKEIINNINPLQLIRLELNRLPEIASFYQHYSVPFDFNKYKIEKESDILNAYVVKIDYPMYNTNILKNTIDNTKIKLNQSKNSVHNKNDDIYLQYIQNKELYKNNKILNQKGFKSIYNGFNIQFDFKNNLIEVFLPPKETHTIDMRNNNETYTKLYCELQIVNPKYR